MHFKYLEKSTDNIVLEGSGRAVGSKLDIRLHLRITEGNNESLVAWTAQVEFGRLLKLFGEKLVRDVSKTIIDDLTECLSTKLASP
jgi:carbon monoxide dehydrogenase subunit G